MVDDHVLTANPQFENYPNNSEEVGDNKTRRTSEIAPGFSQFPGVRLFYNVRPPVMFVG